MTEKVLFREGIGDVCSERVEKLKISNREKCQALLDLKEKYTVDVKVQTQKAFNWCYTSALTKYKIMVNDAEDEEEGDEEEEKEYGSNLVQDLIAIVNKDDGSVDASEKTVSDVVIQVND